MLFLGPLAGPESQRAVNRTWVLALRTLAVLPPAGVLFVVFWYWWLGAEFDPYFRPRESITVGLTVVEFMLITAALAMSPALLAGSLAGDKAAGFLALLLGSQVTAGEIVRGRLAGRLSIVALMLLATLPVLALLAGLCGLNWTSQAMLVAVPASVALGGGGMALGASAISRRGRDALFAVYLVDLVCLLVPVFGARRLPYQVLEWLAPLNPYAPVGPLIEAQNLRPALISVGLWTTLGLLGSIWAAWRLRPAFLRDADNAPRRTTRRRSEVPPVGDRLMLWKELHIEQRKEVNRFVRIVVLLIVVALIACATLSAAAAVVTVWRPGWISVPPEEIAGWIAGTSLPLSWLIQVALGLRAAVTVASEREQNTWDNLLTTPLEGHEIVWAKIWGSVHALRWLMVAVIFSWTVCALTGLFPWYDYLERSLRTIIEGLFMVAIGVFASLACQTATRAMTATLFAWLMAAWAIAFVVGIASASVLLVGSMAMLALDATLQGAASSSSASQMFSPMLWFAVVYLALSLLSYALAAILIAGYCHRNFDRLAGRADPNRSLYFTRPPRQLPVEATIVS